MEAGAVALDQLMDFELDGMSGHGIFELLACGASSVAGSSGSRGEHLSRRDQVGRSQVVLMVERSGRRWTDPIMTSMLTID
jgi:hypothetical protein